MGEMAERKGISGSTLKIIAIVTMFVDHAGYAFSNGNHLRFMRIIGRVAFPIFIFLLVEGFVHTHDRRRYALRLAGFALLSELPFNLLLTGDVWDIRFAYQNVLFTLLFGFLTIWGLEKVESCVHQFWLRTVASGILIFGGMFLAELFQTDYAAAGVLAIVAMYLLRAQKATGVLAGCLVLCSLGGLEWYCLAAVIPILLYNGRRGLRLKYIFYAFYPVHLLFLYMIARFAGFY